uniref:Uncharacterized protein n=1 Tax=Anguilla anguilla TaxID=7936 RepID=A0A0E9QLR8_ANGAN
MMLIIIPKFIMNYKPILKTVEIPIPVSFALIGLFQLFVFLSVLMFAISFSLSDADKK